MPNIHNLHLHQFMHTWFNAFFFKKITRKTIVLMFTIHDYFLPFHYIFTLAYWFGIRELLVSLSLDTAIDLLYVDDFSNLLSFFFWRFLSCNISFLASNGRVIQISGFTCGNLHVIMVFVAVTMSNSSSEMVKTWIWYLLISANNFLTLSFLTLLDYWL
jgi:hypothetical protein